MRPKFLRYFALSAVCFASLVSPAQAGKYLDTGEKFQSVEDLLEICRFVVPGQTTTKELISRFGQPQNQLKKKQPTRNWYTWRAGDPVVQILVWWDARTDVIEAASGKYQYFKKGQWLWANTSTIPVEDRCKLKSEVIQN